MFDLKGKTAIITGATRGIGKSIAEQMALKGAQVVVSSRKAEACETVADTIRQMAGADAAFPVPCNISDKKQLQDLVDRSTAHYGKVDIRGLQCSPRTFSDHCGRGFCQNHRHQPEIDPLALPYGAARNGRAAGRCHCDHLLDRRHSGIGRDRDIWYQQSR